jgi:hypothetical protein
MMTAEELARFFHDTYERLSGQGRSWSELGDDNKATLIAAMREVLCKLYGEDFVKWQETSKAEYAKYLLKRDKGVAEQFRVCKCGHTVSEHIPMPALDGTPYLLCTVAAGCKESNAPDCGEIQLPGWIFPRCSVPAEVAS